VTLGRSSASLLCPGRPAGIYQHHEQSYNNNKEALSPW
jgi:hypothetical protein